MLHEFYRSNIRVRRYIIESSKRFSGQNWQMHVIVFLQMEENNILICVQNRTSFAWFIKQNVSIFLNLYGISFLILLIKSCQTIFNSLIYVSRLFYFFFKKEQSVIFRRSRQLSGNRVIKFVSPRNCYSARLCRYAAKCLTR